SRGRGRRGARGAAGLDRDRRAAMRLLPVGPDHVRHGADQEQSRAYRRGHRRGHERQYLPLRHLPAHPRRHQAGRCGQGSRQMNGFYRMFPQSDVNGAPGVAGELPASPGRRDWLKTAGALTGLVLTVGASGVVRAAEGDKAEKKYGADGMPHGTVDDPQVFVSIGTDGIVTIIAHRAEMGTGVRTGLPMVVADELEADWDRVRVIQAPGDEPRYGNQD